MGGAAKSSVPSAAPAAGGVEWSAEPELNPLFSQKKRRLVTLDAEMDKARLKEEAKQMIEKIPTEPQELFQYEIDWESIEQHKVVDEKVRPWVRKKMVEILGEEEPTLTEYLCKKLTERTRPMELLEQLKVVLDEEASMFVVKLWRFLIFSMLMANV